MNNSRVLLYSKSAAEEQKLFWQKNAKLNRPLSPHLTIYRLDVVINFKLTIDFNIKSN